MKNWKHCLLPVAAAFALPAGASPQSSADSTLLYLTGASCMEELDESELERFETYLLHPLNINLSSRSKLVSSGLFTQRQARAIVSYREEYGDIVSIRELYGLDGFDRTVPAVLEPLLSFSLSRTTSDGIKDNGLKVETSSKVALKNGALSARGKLKVGYGDRVEAAVNSNGSFNVNCSFGGRGQARLIVGDYYARFGQGLSMWSGFSMSGFSQPSAFEKHPQGLTPACTYSSSALRGVAADFSVGDIVTSVFCSRGKSDLVAADVSRVGRTLENGLCIYYDSSGQAHLSTDVRFSIAGWDLFGESSLDLKSGALAGIGGLRWNIDYQVAAVALARYYPVLYSCTYAGAAGTSSKCSDEYGASFGYQYKDKSVTLDFAGHQSGAKSPQIKAVALFPVDLTDKWKLTTRLTERFRPDEEFKNKTDFRLDLTYQTGKWKFTGRTELLYGETLSALAYVEAGFVAEHFYAYLRTTVFRVKNWNDRIYVYERGAPGNFNMRAYNGTGISCSLVCKYELKKKHKFYLRLSETELALQYSFVF